MNKKQNIRNTNLKLRSDRLTNISLNDKELEASVLSILLWKPETRENIYMLSADDFFFDNYQAIFISFEDLISNGKEFTPESIPPSIKKIPGFIDIINRGNSSLSAHFNHYVESLKKLSGWRSIQRLALDITIKSEEEIPIAEIKNYTIDYMDRIKTHSGNQSKQNEIIDEEFVDKFLHKEKWHGIMTGFTELDKCLGGLCPSTFTILAGAPGVGKTTMFLNMINHICYKRNKKILLASLEMSYIHLQAKLISEITGINSRKMTIPTWQLTETEKASINKARKRIAEYQLYRMGEAKVSPNDIEEEIQRLNGIDILFIDYLQLMEPNEYVVSRYDRVSQVSRDLKRMANKLKIPIVCISSLKRPGENNTKPTLHDLRDSGNIEYDIDAALLLYKEKETDKYEEDANEEMKVCQLIIAKNRFGMECYTI